MNPEPRAAPSVPPPAPPPVSTTGRPGGLPRWTGKPVRRLTSAELAEALEYLERHRPDDDVLGRALAGEFARRTAAAEFARRAAADRVRVPGSRIPDIRVPDALVPDGRASDRRGLDDAPGRERAFGAFPPGTPASPDLDGPGRPPLTPPPGHPRTPR
ncbi:hypothetical protein [Actinomadura sp. WMMA1423]|uniref:hypothetical protein n=1 Tax=Actinomadura sp. WMMA1423 TaxID=2591108 RepID=UPI0011476581|nr:hypothetical protein [Actinomadura sp. WMMA1423]